MASVARFARNTTAGISPENSRRIFRLIDRALSLAAVNFWNSTACESTSLTSEAPRTLSLITRFSRSMAFCASPNRRRTRASTTWKVTPMIGSTAITTSPSCQLIDRSSTLAPMMRKTDDTSAPTACDT